jgi:predicted phage baseplate assembly protein
MSDIDQTDCGCCEGIAVQTPAEIYNRPGLSAIAYRVGTYSQFKYSMQARLADADLPGLTPLKTRADDDFTIALLDSWAVVADILTFYQERIANESYKRTATEPRSLLELARLVNYKLQPGVAANTYLAFTLEDAIGSPDQTTIGIGTKVQSLPNPGEKPVVFETTEEIEAHTAWNALKPGLTKEQVISPDMLQSDMLQITLQGTNTNLHPRDVLLIVAKDKTGFARVSRHVKIVTIEAPKQQTSVQFEPLVFSPTTGQAPSPIIPPAPEPVLALPAAGQTTSAATPPAPEPMLALPAAGQTTSAAAAPATGSAPIPPRAGGWLSRFGSFFTGNRISGDGQPITATPQQAAPQTPAPPSPDGQNSKGQPQIDLTAFKDVTTLDNMVVSNLTSVPGLSHHNIEDLALVKGWSIKDVFASIAAQPPQPPASANGLTMGTSDARVAVKPDVCALRVRASLFGYNAPDWKAMLDDIRVRYPSPGGSDWKLDPQQQKPNQLDLDRVYPQIIPGSWLVVEQPGKDSMITEITQVMSVIETAAANYTLSAKITRLTVDPPITPPTTFEDHRKVTVYCQSEQLILAQVPNTDLVQDRSIDIPGLTDGPESGRTVMVVGQPDNSSGLPLAEIAILGDSEVVPGKTTLNFKEKLANIYKRDTVSIYGNVVRATQGETIQDEVPGSGDASQPYQRFTLRQFPLTYIQAPTADGKVSTLSISVNGIPWKEVDTFYGRGPRERVYVTHIEDDLKVTIEFGDGSTGARLPTGEDNVHATYRKGTGLQGVVQPGQLSVLQKRPLGVKSVTNPLAPTGADDPETIDDARRNASNTIFTLDRIVSGEDYEQFARSYAGVAKAQATTLWANRAWSVYVTIAGPPTSDALEGTKITPDTPLYAKIYSGMRRASDPTVPFTLQTYSLILFRLAARVKVDPDNPPDQVLRAVEQAVVAHFSFDARSFGQGVTLEEITAVMQAVPGVVTLHIDTFYQYLKEAKTNRDERIGAALPYVQANGTVSSVAELLIAAPQPFDSLEVML